MQRIRYREKVMGFFMEYFCFTVAVVLLAQRPLVCCDSSDTTVSGRDTHGKNGTWMNASNPLEQSSSSTCDQKPLIVTTVFFMVLSIALAVALALSLIAVCKLRHGIIVLNSSGRRISAGINEAYGIIEDMKCSGMPGTMEGKQSQNGETRDNESADETEYTYLDVGGHNSPRIPPKVDNPQYNTVDAPVKSTQDSLSLPKTNDNTAGSDPEDSLEYAYTATRFSFNLEPHDKAESSYIMSPMTKPVCDDVDISTSENAAYTAVKQSDTSAKVDSKPATSPTTSAVPLRVKKDQPSPANVYTDTGTMKKEMMAGNRVSALAQGFKIRLNPAQMS